MNKLLLLLTLAPCLVFGQTTLIPDPNFEQALIDLGYDSVSDGSVLTANIDNITSLGVSGDSISDLTGIEAFTALTYLNCKINQLTSLDVSQNTALTYLDCQSNQLTSLDVSQVVALTLLDCSYNQLISLDVSQHTVLFWLDCFSNALTSLDVSNNTALYSLDCQGNQLTCLNVKNGNNTNMNCTADDNPNLTCIEVDDVAYSTANWTNIDPQISFSEDCNNPCSSGTTGIPELPTKPKELLYITDILGRTIQPTSNTLLFYIYEDGSVEKKIQIER